MSIKIQINSLDALERLINGDSDTQEIGICPEYHDYYTYINLEEEC